MEWTAFLEWLALVLGFYMAWNIGANDVANAMGTSVGSKALTLKKAVILAAVLEFSGAFLAGSNVSATIQKGIIDPSVFAHDPTIFVLGMLASLLATGLLLQLASYFALPVSTTHAIVGAILGFGLFVGGPHSVQWQEVTAIGLSWVLSPLLSAFISFCLFFCIKKMILESSHPVRALVRVIPAAFSSIIAFGSFLFLPPIFVELGLYASQEIVISSSLCFGGAMFYFSGGALKKMDLVTGPVASGQDGSNSAEKVFGVLQIASACMVAFGHGANDVSNAIGPVAAVLSVLKTQVLDSHALIPSWLLGFGGIGIVIGLATWGWRVIETVGKKITELTPSRGFAAEFGTAATVLLASKFGLPISTTHALVGAIMGVGLVSGVKSLNFSIFKSILVSWITTLPLCAIFSMTIFSLLKFIFV